MFDMLLFLTFVFG